MNWKEAMSICKRLQDKPLPLTYKGNLVCYSSELDVEGNLYLTARSYLEYHKFSNIFKTIAPKFGVKLNSHSQ